MEDEKNKEIIRPASERASVEVPSITATSPNSTHNSVELVNYSTNGNPSGNAAKQAPALGFDLKPGWSILPPEELPLPTYWPVVMALAITLFSFGFISSNLIIIAGVILFIVSLIGWIGDIQNEQGHGHPH